MELPATFFSHFIVIASSQSSSTQYINLAFLVIATRLHEVLIQLNSFFASSQSSLHQHVKAKPHMALVNTSGESEETPLLTPVPFGLPGAPRKVEARG